MNRREFLGVSVAGTGSMLLSGELVGRPVTDTGSGEWPPRLPDVKIHKVFVGGKGGWPTPELDTQAEIARLEKHLSDTERRLGDIKFVGSNEWVNSEDEAIKVAANLGDADGVLVFNSGCVLENLLEPILNTGRPTVLFSQPYFGHDWCKVCKMPKAGKKVVLLATSDYDEITEIAGVMRAAPRLRQTRIIHIGRQWGVTLSPKLEETLGVEIVPIDMDRFRKVYHAVDNKAVQAEAEQWMQQAEKVIEPSKDDILKASRVYWAMKQIIGEEGAQAITINCLGGFALAELGHPCIGFSKLNDQGIVAAARQTWTPR